MTQRRNPPICWILDGTNLCHRDAHAMGLSRAAGNLASRLGLIRRHWSPDRLVVAFDGPGRTWRHDLFPAYKAGRNRLPGIGDAITDAIDATDRDGFATAIRLPGTEADDIIATVTAQALAAGSLVVIYSADGDLHQLLREGEVTQLTLLRRRSNGDGPNIETKWVTSTDLARTTGICSGQWVDYRAMVGDASDNVSGVDGIGPKTAVAILQACVTLDRFYRDPFRAPITPKQRTRLINARERIDTLRRLFTLRTDVAIPDLIHAEA